MQTALALPKVLKQFEGRITDVDSHEMVPAQEWHKVFGPDVKRLQDIWLAKEETEANDKNSPNVPGYPGDVLNIGDDITRLKGARAPGARDALRRVDVMNAMGVSRQLMFSSYVGIFGLILQLLPDSVFLSDIKDGRRAYGKRMMEVYNEWAAGVGRATDRIRPVVPVYGETPAEVIANAKRELSRGIRAIQLPAGNLPGGVSPAHPALYPLWEMLSEANCPLVLHIGCEGQFFETRDWGKAPVFEGFRNLGEFNVDPWSLSILHLPFQNFTATMVVGGVFARFPKLRLGVIEVGSHWVGPMMRALDNWYINSQAFKSAGTYRLPELPSSYIRSNLRVSPYFFEDADVLIETYGLEDVLCFSTDYPHVEGGRDMLQTYYDKIARLGPKVVEKFFITNGTWLLPD
jgi:predicted TIM-barrel fold metal-dependent hydrolase